VGPIRTEMCISASPSTCADNTRPLRYIAEYLAALVTVAVTCGRDGNEQRKQMMWRTDTRWRFEFFHSFCSAWAAAQLWFLPTHRPSGDTPMSLLAGLRGHERFWALVCMVAALVRLSGHPAALAGSGPGCRGP
jgi:hypothetical protein